MALFALEVTHGPGMEGGGRGALRELSRDAINQASGCGEGNEDSHVQRTALPLWALHTMECCRVDSPAPDETPQTLKDRLPFLISDPWQGHFPTRTPGCVTGRINMQVKC
jgi:hypothetical protein